MQAPNWIDLPPEIFFQVVECLPNNFADLLAAAGVCCNWRENVMASQALMQNVSVKFSKAGPLKSGNAMPRCAHALKRAQETSGRITLPVPKILLALQDAGNIDSTVAIAKIHDWRGNPSRALRFWKHAAKNGIAEGQFRIGEAFYQGEGDMGRDAEEALMWLQRAAKNPHSTQPILAASATILGYLHMDGEGTKTDNLLATKWFAIGKEHGNKEAEKTLGWMWNTGQFG